MICDKAFAIYMKRAAIPMKKHSPSQLRIRPARAGTPCLCATHPCQIPRMFSTGAARATCRPLSPRPWTSNQNPRTKDSGLRKPKSREKFAALLPSCVPCTAGGCSLAGCSQSSVPSVSGCWLSSLGRAWRIQGCYQNLRYFGVAATSHPQPFTFHTRGVLTSP